MDLVRKTLHIADFDQLKEVLQGWETEPVQLTSGPLDLLTETVSNSDFTLLRLSLAPRIADRAVVHPGVVGFVLVERPQTWCGLEIEPPAVLLQRPGRETRSVLEPGFRSLEFYFAEQDLANHSLGRRLASATFEPERSVFPVSDAALNQLRAASDAIFSWAGPSDLGAASEMLQFAARDRLLDLLEDIVTPSLHTTALRRPPTRRARAGLALAALAEIDRVGVGNATLTQICTGLGVSRRALEKAFQSVTGVSPGQYLLAYRLNHVRNRLRTDGGRVLESALTAGFTDPSRFAFQYRRLFGELPSQTVQRSRDSLS